MIKKFIFAVVGALAFNEAIKYLKKREQETTAPDYASGRPIVPATLIEEEPDALLYSNELVRDPQTGDLVFEDEIVEIQGDTIDSPPPFYVKPYDDGAAVSMDDLYEEAPNPSGTSPTGGQWDNQNDPRQRPPAPPTGCPRGYQLYFNETLWKWACKKTSI